MVQYFLPTPRNVNPTRDEIIAAGLDYAIGHAKGRHCIGPDGKPGFVYHPDVSQVGEMRLAEQTWVASPKYGRDETPYYVGFTSDEVILPEHLARDAQLPGEEVRMMDGSKWLVPRLMSWYDGGEQPAVYETHLPCSIDLDDEGNVVSGPVVRQYRDLFDTGMRVMAAINGRGETSMTNTQFMVFAANCLGVNYRVSLFELSSKFLDCMSSENAVAVVRAALDQEGYETAVGNFMGRLTRPNGDTPSGSTDGTPDTDLPSDN